MKRLRFVLAVVLMSLSTVAFAQSDSQKPVAQSDAQKMDAPKAAAPKSDAQMSFDTMKKLAGSWEGPVTTSPQAVEVEGKPAQILLRVTSRGNALMHDLTIAGIPDNPITMFYLDSDRMLLTHYCDAGNRPRMTGKMSPDGKKVEFEFLDIAGNPQYHMHHAVFTIIDANHHTEDWTFMMKDKPIHAHFDLQRIKGGSAGAGQ
jgi:hypothetical protein